LVLFVVWWGAPSLIAPTANPLFERVLCGGLWCCGEAIGGLGELGLLVCVR
jgi:hypothetical protein